MNGTELAADCLLVAAGRASNTDGLGLELVGDELAERGLVRVSEHYQTSLPKIYAAGDVIGFPALASTSIAQARTAIQHAFRPAEEAPASSVLPFGIYTIPECTMVGETEEQLLARGVRPKVLAEIELEHPPIGWSPISKSKLLSRETAIC